MIKIVPVLLVAAALAAISAKIIHADWFYMFSNPFILISCIASVALLLTTKSEKTRLYRIIGMALGLLVLVMTGAMATDNPTLWLITDPAIVITCTLSGWAVARVAFPKKESDNN